VKPRTYHVTDREKHGSAKDRDWRSAVFLRDNYTCQICGTEGGKLQSHHIESWKTHPELRWDINNGQTLCLTCHKGTGSYGGKNTKR
jgi:5-methylcytosine-specific restriction endonuclease McrA